MQWQLEKEHLTHEYYDRRNSKTSAKILDLNKKIEDENIDVKLPEKWNNVIEEIKEAPEIDPKPPSPKPSPPDQLVEYKNKFYQKWEDILDLLKTNNLNKIKDVWNSFNSIQLE